RAEPVVRHQPERRVDTGVIAAAARVGLEAHAFGPPDAAQILVDLVEADIIGGRREKPAVLGLQNVSRALKALLREESGEDAALRGAAGMETFAHGAVGIERPQACG